MADKQRAAQGALETNSGIHGADGSDMSDAATAWESVLGGEDPIEEHDDQADGEEELTDEAQEEPEDDEDEDDDSDEDESEDDDPDDEDEDEDDDDDEDDSKAPEIDPNTKVRVKIDGEEQEVTFDELKAGYSRTQDYTRKTQEVAQQRQAVEQEKDQVLQQQQQWSQLLSTFQQRLQATLSGRSEAEWQALKQQDEISYYEERDRERTIQERIQAAQTEQQRVAQESQQRHQQQLQQQAQAEQERLLEVIEDWKDPEVKAKDISTINEYAMKVAGFQPQELQGIIDHRAIRVLRDAAKYQELMKAKEAPATKPKKSKVRTKTLKPGTPSNQKPSSVKRRKASQRLAKEHSVEAAAGWFETQLGD